MVHGTDVSTSKTYLTAINKCVNWKWQRGLRPNHDIVDVAVVGDDVVVYVVVVVVV